MGFIRSALANTLSWPRLSATDERVWEPGWSQRTRSGTRVNADTALTIAAVYAAVRLLSSTVGMIPLHVYRRLSDGVSKDLARNHPLEEVLARRPNRWQTSMEWRQMMEAHRLLVGNGYSEIVSNDQLGFVGELVPRNPHRMRVEPTMRGDDIVYIYAGDGGRERRIPADRMYHIKGLSTDGITGISTVAAARESFGLALATEEHGARTFGQGTRLSGVLQTDQELSPQATKRLAANWQSTYGGVENTAKVAVLEQGLTWSAVAMTSEDAQFLESRKFQITDIARWFGVPPHMIGDLERATFSNIEEQQIEYVVYAVMPLLVGWEQQISRSLITRDDVYFAEFTVEGLLRGDIESRYRAYQIATGGRPWMSGNEVRQRENMNPRDGLNDIPVQENIFGPGTSPAPETVVIGSNGHGHE